MTTGLVNIVSNEEVYWTSFGGFDFQAVLHNGPCGYPTAYPQAVWQLCVPCCLQFCVASRIFLEFSNFSISASRLFFGRFGLSGVAFRLSGLLNKGGIQE
jgi:hypothetical protein